MSTTMGEGFSGSRGAPRGCSRWCWTAGGHQSACCRRAHTRLPTALTAVQQHDCGQHGPHSGVRGDVTAVATACNVASRHRAPHGQRHPAEAPSCGVQEREAGRAAAVTDSLLSVHAPPPQAIPLSDATKAFYIFTNYKARPCGRLCSWWCTGHGCTGSRQWRLRPSCWTPMPCPAAAAAFILAPPARSCASSAQPSTLKLLAATAGSAERAG